MKPPCGNRKSKDILHVLLDPLSREIAPWTCDDLRAILEHQLALPLATEVDRLRDSGPGRTQGGSAVPEEWRRRTFQEILMHDAPPLQVLRWIKDYAKASITTEGDLPRKVAHVLYTLTLLKARAIGAPRLTRLDDRSVECAARQCLTLAWLPSQVRQQLRTNLRHLPKE